MLFGTTQKGADWGPCPQCGHHCPLWKKLRSKRWKRGELLKVLKMFHTDEEPVEEDHQHEGQEEKAR
jgi:hypothetical protein